MSGFVVAVLDVYWAGDWMSSRRLAWSAAAAVLLLLSVQCAMAGDLGRASLKDSRPFSWTGFYVGAQIGGGFADNDWLTPPTNFHANWDSRGVFGGVNAGYNRQIGSVVVGIQVEFNASGVGAMRQSLSRMT